ncbi:alpha/beta fold hydrolase [Lentzea chajnantorensis]
MAVELTLTRLAGTENSQRLLIVGPSLGSSVSQLWRTCAEQLDDVEVIGWDLPGHGNGKNATGPFTVQDIANALERPTPDRPTAYAGVSFGGAVGLELAPKGVFDQVFCIAAASRIGDPMMWHERAELVRKAGTSVLVEGASRRWFAPGFIDREPAVAGAMLRALTEVDDDSYAWACEALAGFQAEEVERSVHAIAGRHDVVVPPEAMEQLNAASFHVIEDCGHLPPVEKPGAVAGVLAGEWAK